MHLQTVWLFIITFFFLVVFLGKSMTHFSSPLPPIFLSIALSFFRQVWDRSAPLINGPLPHFLTRHFLLSQGAFLAAVHFILHQPNRSAEGERLTSFCLLVRSPSLRFERTDAHETKPINCPLCGSFSKRPITWSKHDVAHAGIWSVARKRVIKFITADP